MTAVIGLVIYTLPYVFIVVLITMGRYHPEQTEAARSCGASGWQAFWHIEFPQIRPGILSAASFVHNPDLQRIHAHKHAEGWLRYLYYRIDFADVEHGDVRAIIRHGRDCQLCGYAGYRGGYHQHIVSIERLEKVARTKNTPDMSG